jgi:hypothetical protein
MALRWPSLSSAILGGPTARHNLRSGASMPSQIVAATACFGGSCSPLSGVAAGLTLRVC